jgi:pilus assembly protein CpaB
MKHQRALWMMAVAVLLGVLAVLLASRWLLQQPGARTRKIVITAADIQLGQRIAPEMVRLVDWPGNAVPAGAFTDPAKLQGRVVRANIASGEPLSEAKLAPPGTTGGLSALISEGKRAISVRVNDVIGVAGFALPGNFVDVLVHTQQEAPEQARGPDISKIVLERILVLAVAQEVNRDETKPRVVNAVTLEVTPEQAEQLDLARSVGTLSLVLRNQIDPAPAATAGATKRDLLPKASSGAAATAPAARMPEAPALVRHAATAARRTQQCVHVLNGTQSGKECFQ